MKENRLSLSADAPETDCPQQPDSARHARRFELLINVYMALLYAHFGFALAGIVPYWTLTLSAAVLVPRWMLAVHELFHIRSERQVAWLTRLLPLALTPLVLGYTGSTGRFISATIATWRHKTIRTSFISAAVNSPVLSMP